MVGPIVITAFTIKKNKTKQEISLTKNTAQHSATNVNWSFNILKPVNTHCICIIFSVNATKLFTNYDYNDQKIWTLLKNQQKRQRKDILSLIFVFRNYTDISALILRVVDVKMLFHAPFGKLGASYDECFQSRLKLLCCTGKLSLTS